MADVQVTCINKPNRSSTHEAITHLGGYNWKLTRMDVVQRIQIQRDTFFTLSNGKRANLHVRQSPNGTMYVQTEADGSWTNNLLSLPECR